MHTDNESDNKTAQVSEQSPPPKFDSQNNSSLINLKQIGSPLKKEPEVKAAIPMTKPLQRVEEKKKDKYKER